MLYKLIKRENFEKFKKIAYVINEYPCFDKLEINYRIQRYKSITHLIRSIGARSALALLFCDIRYCFSEKDFILII